MKRFGYVLALSLLFLLTPLSTLAASPGLDLNGSELSVAWITPFVCMLLSIAFMPLLTPVFWHHHFGKVAFFWALAFVVPCAFVYGLPLASYQVVHVLLLEYIPFLLLLFALFTVAGGVCLTGDLAGSPTVNTILLAMGTFLASWMGTTGAAMLLIRPLLRANAHRQYKVHSVVFFIFLVANIGGSLTPLGDPPLFLGFLKGIDFFWTINHLFAMTTLLSVILLCVYFCLDFWLFNKEGRPVPPREPGSTPQKLGLKGSVNLLLLLCVVAAVLMSGMWNPGVVFNLYGTELKLQDIVRDVLMIIVAMASLRFTPGEFRALNGFSWAPIVEVGKLFLGIFISMIPAIAILRAGTAGALAPIIRLVSDNGQPVNTMYFWLTGLLSSFLDNAPTYLVFFNTAGGDPARLMGEWAGTLAAISAGAVFMGSVTYIGNAPNFMVRSIAVEQGVEMPSFFGYMAWSVAILFPCFALLTLLFFL
jgi:Na+/H+ antiporter NhaD and related arsenite permeases